MEKISKIKDSVEHKSMLYLKENFIKDEEFELKANRKGHVIDLTIKNVKFKRIPEEFKKFLYLQRLSIGYSHFERIEGLERLKDLRELILDGNAILKIEGLERLRQLNILYLSVNRISKIEGLENLVQLEKLYLQNNHISKIEGLDRLTKLQELSLKDNKIVKIEGLKNLKKLQYLDLSENPIKKLEGLKNITNLKTFLIDFITLDEENKKLHGDCFRSDGKFKRSCIKKFV